MTKLGYPEAEAMNLTLRKFTLLYHEYLDFHGLIKHPATIDDLP